MIKNKNHRFDPKRHNPSFEHESVHFDYDDRQENDNSVPQENNNYIRQENEIDKLCSTNLFYPNNPTSYAYNTNLKIIFEIGGQIITEYLNTNESIQSFATKLSIKYNMPVEYFIQNIIKSLEKAREIMETEEIVIDNNEVDMNMNLNMNMNMNMNLIDNENFFEIEKNSNRNNNEEDFKGSINLNSTSKLSSKLSLAGKPSSSTKLHGMNPNNNTNNNNNTSGRSFNSQGFHLQQHSKDQNSNYNSNSNIRRPSHQHSISNTDQIHKNSNFIGNASNEKICLTVDSSRSKKNNITIGDRLYHKGSALTENRGKSIEKMRHNKEKIEMEQCTFSPKINQGSIMLTIKVNTKFKKKE